MGVTGFFQRFFSVESIAIFAGSAVGGKCSGCSQCSSGCIGGRDLPETEKTAVPKLDLFLHRHQG